jgi:hypothetical protein
MRQQNIQIVKPNFAFTVAQRENTCRVRQSVMAKTGEASRSRTDAARPHDPLPFAR